MSVGESSRGKVKAARDFYRRKESKSSCPILSCDGCEDAEEETAVRNDRTLSPKAVGSVAARAQAWEKSTSSAGYVTIGSVRYGVRFSSTSNDEAVPSRGSAGNDHEENDYCCDVMQMAWPRPRGASLPPSKIPLPNAEKTQAINKRGKASEERATPVCRSALEVSRPKKSPVGCFAVDSDESSSGEMKATPPTPNPARRPLFPKPNFKFGNSSGEADTSRLIPDSKEEIGSGNQFQITLDKLHRFRFGGSNDKTNGNQKKKRSGDKTERLRELTDKLLHSRGAAAGNAERKKPPTNSTSLPSKLAGKQTTGPSLRNLFGSTSSLAGSQSRAHPKREGSVDAHPEKGKDCEGEDSRKVDPKPTCAQRMIAFRSASFSQVDYDTADGKYTRTNRKDGDPPKPPSIGCVTFPRVKQVDASTSVSPPPDKVTEKTGSTPSVDSAVGSDEGFVIGSSNNLALISDSHKPSGSRSLTYPFTKKISKSDEMPFSSIDGNGLKSLQHSPSLNRELSDVKEEVSVSSETPTIGDTLSECSNETVKETCDSSLGNSADNSPNPRVSPNPEKAMYQCTVSMQFNTLPVQQDPIGEKTSLETLEKEINDLITQQKGNASPKPEIYVTTWPKDPDSAKKPEKAKLTLKCENDYKNTNWKDEEDSKGKESEGEDSKRGAEGSKRWSGDTSNDCSSEPISPEEGPFKNNWARGSEKPKLMCQSSDEREEEGPPCYRRYQLLNRNDSLSEGDSDHDRRPSTPMRDRERTCSPSPYTPNYDLSDGEGRNGRSSHGPRRYSKRPLRGPYGQMLEAEMKKPETTRLLSKKQLNEDLKFLEEYMAPLPENRSSSNEARPSSESRLNCPRPRFNPGRSLDDSQLQNVYTHSDSRSPKWKPGTSLPFSGPSTPKEGLVVCHQRTTSSPSQLEGISSATPAGDAKANAKATQELLSELLKGSSERRFVTEDNPLGNAQNTKVSAVFWLFGSGTLSPVFHCPRPTNCFLLLPLSSSLRSSPS